MHESIVAMARGAPAQQAELAQQAIQTLDQWHDLATAGTSLDEATEHAGMARVAIDSLQKQRLRMVGKPISLAERNPDDPDELSTWSLADQAFGAINHLSDVLVGHTKEVERKLQELIVEAQKKQAAELEAEAKPSLGTRLKFWKS